MRISRELERSTSLQPNTNRSQVQQRSRSIISCLKFVRAPAVSIPGLHTSNPLSRLKTSWDEFFRFLQNSVSQRFMQRLWIASKLDLESYRSLLATMRFSMLIIRMSCLMLPLIQYFVRECRCPCLLSLRENQKRMIGAQCRIVNLRMSLTFLAEGVGRHSTLSAEMTS